ncbi:MAG TPA: hypothetical protein VKH37_02180 [Ferruginibacter sp.]|nr:hypothetical protein [Ferruginibacter sp.]
MPQKKSLLSASDNLPDFLYRSRWVIVVLISMVILLASCDKAKIEAKAISAAQQYFEDNVIGRDFRVELATDNGTDITSQYTGFLFRLNKNTSYDGPMTGTIGATVYNGTWSSNDDYSKLVINLPNSPSAFLFLNREWKFTKKTFPVMELAPWGTTEPDVLHMERL